MGVAAWSPDADRWRVVTGFPEGAPPAVWTGAELLSWEKAEAVDPVSGATRPLPPLHFEDPKLFGVPPKAWWAGDAVHVFGPHFFWQLDPATGGTNCASPVSARNC